MLEILFLGYNDSPILQFLSKEANVTQTTEKISLQEINNIDPDFIISYGYTHIIKKNVIEAYSEKIINLHISYLPWNKGMYPNIWSIIDDTPKGVTIHMMDDGIDTGDILFQEKVRINDDDTLSTSYWKLRASIESLFIRKWHLIKAGKFDRVKQVPDGTFHLKKTSEIYFKTLGIFNNWETTVKDLKSRSDEDIINEVQAIRAKNNTHWMDVVKLAFRVSPVEARDIFKKIKYCDFKINELLKELAENESGKLS
jgi:folate-dependent phosphoribosylglycinamide formyltransferase PurN